MNVNRLSPAAIDRELGSWLREEAVTGASSGLVEDIFARTSRTRQVRRLGPWRAVRFDPIASPRASGVRPRRLSALGGLAAVLVAAILLSIFGRPAGVGPGSGTSPPPSASPSPPVGSPVPSQTGSQPATAPGRRLDLGPDSAPIDVIEAFGSIWVAEIHGNAVLRLDAATMTEVARITVPSAAWFAVADGALWVTSQTGTGLSRIDPATNRVVAHVGDVAPCAAPVVAFGSLWQSACDAGVFLRIDPARNVVVDTIPAEGHGFLVLAENQLITTGPAGLARLDPATGTFATIGDRAAIGAELLVSDGTTVWVQNSAGFARIDPAGSSPTVGFSYLDPGGVSTAGDHAWLMVRGQGAVQIDLATNETVRTIPVPGTPLVPREAAGVLWITDFDDNALWRIGL